jgi:hypothetical protein
VREHENEPVRGLPEDLPEGERILWQGTPRWGALAIRALHIRAVAIYFALLFAWIAGSQLSAGVSLSTALASGGRLMLVALAVLALLALFAYFIQRATVYTITNRRVVLRFGVALPMTMNIPFSAIHAAGLKLYGDGTGDIPLTLGGTGRQSLIVLWPHVRPWRTVRPEPMLRCVPGARQVAATLAAALSAHAGQRSKPFAVAQPVPAENSLAPNAEPAAA